MKTKNAILINPPASGSYRSKIMLGDSLALSSIAQKFLSKNWSVSIFDCFLREWDIAMLMSNLPNKFDLVGITVMSQTALDTVKIIIENIRRINPDVYITVGGSAPTIAPDMFYELDINSLIVGDDVKQIKNLIKDYEEKCFNNNKKVYFPEKYSTYTYDKTFRPDILVAFEQDRILSLESSKGCYGNCNFCSVNFAHSSNWIPRDIENVFNEIDYIKKNVPNCSQLRFVDANFLGGREKYIDRSFLISERLKKEGFGFRIECRVDDVEYNIFKKLKEDGLAGVFLGIENGQQHILNSLSKNIKSEDIMLSINILRILRISYSFGFMMITPQTTKKDIIENVALLRSIKYGIRWKHFFSGLIIEKNRNTNNIKQSLSEKRLGYKCKDLLCLKLVDFYDVCLKEHIDVLELEHIIGIALERGKESKEDWFWDLDEKFSNICIENFESLILELEHTGYVKKHIAQLAEQYMSQLKSKLNLIIDEIRKHGLSDTVMLKSIKDYIW